ncbi:hypothetical protein ALC57_18448 [Trachymyrmex cornetzi]|uniref:Uncharacterized protein n=1 Tax=Trachymyrmex cornetzi TaxID=471704 RepID=A0A151IRY9_9HYME|nr:hypothetical protein ALC57_18448 [Trachymyrmex cornetzi]
MREGQGGERELSREEIRKVTRNLKDGKAMGVDRIPNEVWKRDKGDGEGEVNFEEIQERDREMQRVERWGKIRNSRYSRWYGWVKGEVLPKYLSKGWGEGRWRRVARFRLRNEVKEGRYWEEEEESKCRLCGSGWETWEHI